MSKNSFIRRITAAALVIMLSGALTAGCTSGSGQPSGDGPADPSPSVTDTENGGQNGTDGDNGPGKEEAGLTYSTESSGVKVTLSIDKSEYEKGETVKYTITIENGKKYHYTSKTNLRYTNSTYFGESSEGSMPIAVPKLEYGESTVIAGSMTEREEGFSGNAAVTTPASGDYESISLRPYIMFTYGGEEAMIRVTMELHAYQQKVNIDKEHKKAVKTITVHDPSIFKDKDGTYYLFGTHITGGRSDDLMEWTSFNNSLRTKFSNETIAQIREWNRDSGEWFGYLWAPDVVYNPTMGKYCYYLSANGDDWVSNIVMLTADNPDGPYTYAGSVVYGGFTKETAGDTDVLRALEVDELPERYIKNGIENRKWGDKWPNCIDPCVFYDDDGKLWMSYGSWSGGIFILELDEETGLRDYSVKYETDDHSDAYFGKKIAGGWYVTGEGSYIQKIGDWYWLFMSYGGLEAKGGYNIRVFRSKRPDGDYVDMLGNTPLFDRYVLNVNQSVGVRLFGNYKWRTMNVGQVAQGHNSAFVDDDGRAYIIYHSRTTDGSEGHTVKVHQLFLNKDGWLVAAPYYFADEKLDGSGVDSSSFAGDYEIILHRLNVDYGNLKTNKPEFITLEVDGRVTGDYDGSWEIEKGTSNITVTLGKDVYTGVALKQCIEGTDIETDVFTVVGTDNQLTLWGSKTID